MKKQPKFEDNFISNLWNWQNSKFSSSYRRIFQISFNVRAKFRFFRMNTFSKTYNIATSFLLPLFYCHWRWHFAHLFRQRTGVSRLRRPRKTVWVSWLLFFLLIISWIISLRGYLIYYYSYFLLIMISLRLRLSNPLLQLFPFNYDCA